MSQSKKERNKQAKELKFPDIFADFKHRLATTQLQVTVQAQKPITLKKPADIKQYIKNHNGVIFTWNHDDSNNIWIYLKNQIPIWSELGVSQIYLELDRKEKQALDTLLKTEMREDWSRIKFYRALQEHNISIEAPFPDKPTSSNKFEWFKSRIESDSVVVDYIKKNHKRGPIISIVGAYHVYIGVALNLPVIHIGTRNYPDPRMKALPPHIFTKTATKPENLPTEFWDYLQLLETAQLGMQVEEERSRLVPVIAIMMVLLVLAYMVSKAVNLEENSAPRP